MARFPSASASGRWLTTRLLSMWMGRRFAPGAITLTILIPAHLTVTTAQTGFPADSLSEPARGTPAGMDARGAGAGVTRGADGAGVRMPITATAADTAITAVTAIGGDTGTAITADSAAATAAAAPMDAPPTTGTAAA